MNVENLKPCPFCKSTNLDWWKDESYDKIHYYIFCVDCLARGGEGLTHSQADIFWNTRTE